MNPSKKKVLGKGLDAILGPTRTEERIEKPFDLEKGEFVGEQILLINPAQIMPSKVQMRKTFREESIQKLADSIKKHGLQEPVIVRKSGDKYEVVCGERRLRACILADLKEIPVICRNVSDDEAILLGLIENIQREDLNPIEEAEAYQSILNRFNWSQEQLSEMVGKDRSTIANALRLLSLPSTVQDMVIEGKLTMGHARALLGLPNSETIIQVAISVVERGLSVRQTEQLVSRLKDATKKKPIAGKKTKSIQIIELEEQLCRKLGTKVSIKHGNLGKGKIEVSYFSNEELSRILEILGINVE